MKKFTGVLIAGSILLSGTAFAKDIQVCFTSTGSKCGQQVASLINQADNTIQLQAYKLTSPKIITALSQAKKRGVKVDILLDQWNVFNSKPALTALKNAHMSYRIDAASDMALSNVMIVDGQQVVTGAASFIQPEKKKVTDDIVFIRDTPAVVNQYVTHFAQREKMSETQEAFCKHSAQCKFSQAAGSVKNAASDVWSGTKNFWHKHVTGDSDKQK